MSLIVHDTQAILDAYEAKKRERGLTFSPPPEKAKLGELAFPGDLIQQILVGIIGAVFKELTSIFVRFVTNFENKLDPMDVEGIIRDTLAKSAALKEGIQMLKVQGIRGDEAEIAIELLQETLREVLERDVKAAANRA